MLYLPASTVAVVVPSYTRLKLPVAVSVTRAGVMLA